MGWKDRYVQWSENEWEEVLVTSLKALSEICMKGVRETAKDLSWYLLPGQDSNWEPSKLTLELICLKLLNEVIMCAGLGRQEVQVVAYFMLLLWCLHEKTWNHKIHTVSETSWSCNLYLNEIPSKYISYLLLLDVQLFVCDFFWGGGFMDCTVVKLIVP
jgi:hypothetical protein